MLSLAFDADGWDDYVYWQSTDKATLKRVNALIKEVLRTPFEGTGKPESLKHDLVGCWSRRITQEHRMVYRVAGNTLQILKLRYHY